MAVLALCSPTLSILASSPALNDRAWAVLIIFVAVIILLLLGSLGHCYRLLSVDRQAALASGRQRRHEDMLARLAEYARLRDEGVQPIDAARAVGMRDHSAYERWYRVAHLGLPPRRRGEGVGAAFSQWHRPAG